MPVQWTVKPLTSQWTTKTEPGKRTGQTVYQVQASEPVSPALAELADESTNTVPGTNKTPRIGGDFPGATGFPCVGRSCKAMDQTRMLFQVTADYDNTSTYTANPLSQPLQVSYGPEASDESYFKDKTTPDPLYAVTTAGEVFSELPKRKAGHLIIHIEKNVAASTNYSAYEAFCDEDGLLTNNGNVTIDGRTYAAGTLIALPPELSKVQNQDGTLFRTLTTTLLANASGWDQPFESRGLYEWDIISGDILRILDQENNPVESAMPLDDLGASLAADATGATITLKPYGQGDFSVLT